MSIYRKWIETNGMHSFSAPQLGTFRSPEGEYFVEPLHSFQGEHYEEEHTKPHIVYRKRASTKQTTVENSACDTSGMVFAIHTDKDLTTLHILDHTDNSTVMPLRIYKHTKG